MPGGGLGFRAEAINYDEDAPLGQLGVLYRFGQGTTRRRSATTSAVAEAPRESPAPPIAAAPPAPVERSCADELSAGTDRVNFAFGSAEPLVALADRFEPVVEALCSCPDGDAHGDPSQESILRRHGPFVSTMGSGSNRPLPEPIDARHSSFPYSRLAK